MPVTITVTGESMGQVQAELLRMLVGTSTPKATPVAEASDAKPEKPKRAPKAEKVEPAAAAAAEVSQPERIVEVTQEPKQNPVEAPKADEPKPAETSAGPTFEDMRAAIQSVIGKKGDAPARKMLADYGAKKVSEVPEDKRVEFIAAATALVGA